MASKDLRRRRELEQKKNTAEVLFGLLEPLEVASGNMCQNAERMAVCAEDERVCHGSVGEGEETRTSRPYSDPRRSYVCVNDCPPKSRHANMVAAPR